MSFKKKIQNIRPSWRAIVFLWREEFSFKILVLCGFATVALSFVLQISRIEFLIVVLTIGAMLAVEALNTAIEEICDHVTPEEHARIGKIKDIASGAAFLMCSAALVIGLIIFTPYLLHLL
jgi:diacylglycerol kinase